MQMTLSVIAVALNGLALGYVVVAHGRHGWRSARDFFAGTRGRMLLGALLAAIIIPFLLTLPNRPPFSPGMLLGWGILLGGAAGIFLLLMTAAARREGDTAVVGVLAAAGFAPSVALLLFPGDPGDALIGCALGGIAVTLIGSGLLRAMQSPLLLAHSLELYGMACVGVVAAVRLGMEHFPRSAASPAAGGYWAFPALLLGAGVLALAALSTLRTDGITRQFPWFAGGVAAVVMLLVTVALQIRLLPDVSWQVVLFGALALGIVLAMLLHEERTAAVFRPLGLTFGLVLAVLIVVGLAFRQLQGYGEALALLPALIIAGSVYLRREQEERPLAAALGVAAIGLFLLFVFSRLVLEGVGSAQTLDFQRQYDLFALVLGAGATLGIIIVQQQWRIQTGGRLVMPLLRLVVLALLVMAAPVGVLLIFGVKALMAFIIGLALGEMIWMALAAWMVGQERQAVLAGTPHAFLLAAVLAAVQLSPKALELILSRPQRVTLVLVFCGMAALWVLGGAFRRVRQDTGGSEHGA